MDSWERWKRILADERLPCALVDLDAVDANVATLLARVREPVTVRIASKSVRVPALLRRLLDVPRHRGILAYAAHEAEFLAGQGFDDVLVAYPASRKDEALAIARANAAGRRVVAMIDDPAHVRLLEDAARDVGTRIPACVDVDVSWRPLPGVHLGVRRSPVRSAEDAVRVASSVGERVRVEAVMAYEAQVAGLPDVAATPWMSAAFRMIKSGSRPLAAERRRQVVDALRSAGHDVRVVNGGGTGSVASTSEDGTVTEVTVGSGFLCPHLFDGYRGLSLRPAGFFALSVARRSDEDHVTAAMGGVVASGSPGADRLPKVAWPEGLVPVAMEGWGEVQTPFKTTSARPQIGDPIVCRPAKAGEWLERFAEVLLVRGDEIVGREPTYRGMGQCFL